MPINTQTAPSAAKSWSPKITASASGIAIAAVDVLFLGWRFRTPSLAVPCAEPGLYRLVLCRVGDGAAIALERNGRLPDGAEEIVYLARWMLRDGETCAEAEIEVTERTLVGNVPEDVEDVRVGSAVLVHTPTPAERIAAANAATVKAIAQGYEFRGLRFSLSANHQINLTQLYMTRNTPIAGLPVTLANIDDTAWITLSTPEDVEAMATAMGAAKRAALDAGNVAKQER